MTDGDRAKTKKLLDEWEASGAPKTSAYWRLWDSYTSVPIKSVAIKRIVDEMREEGDGEKPGGGYNRVYHRHNR